MKRKNDKPECPVADCGYNANMTAYDKALDRPLIVESTRSHKNEDAWRDMDHFDLDEELARLRRALHEIKPYFTEKAVVKSGPYRNVQLGHKEWQKQTPYGWPLNPQVFAFICEAISNIDENLLRLGPLPKTWMGSSSVKGTR